MGKKYFEPPVLFFGWKEVANYVGRHPRTLRKWNSERCKLARIKTDEENFNSRWFTSLPAVLDWIMKVGSQKQKGLPTA